MAILYIIESQSVNDKFYLGITNREEQRIEEHNRGQTKSTKKYVPWKIIHSENFVSKAEAMRRERYLKSVRGYKERIEIIEKYKTNKK